MFFREFSVLKVKSAVRQSFEFPLSLDECAASPLAGAFTEGQLKAMDRAVGHLPFAQRTHDGRRAWSISAKRGELDVWFTSDGSVFVEVLQWRPRAGRPRPAKRVSRIGRFSTLQRRRLHEARCRSRHRDERDGSRRNVE